MVICVNLNEKFVCFFARCESVKYAGKANTLAVANQNKNKLSTTYLISHQFNVGSVSYLN